LTENITKVIHKFQDSILSEVACGCGFWCLFIKFSLTSHVPILPREKNK
jgi:hypothetical protein